MLTKLAKVDSNDATLSALTLTDVPLTFAPKTYDYTVTVANDVMTTDVTADDDPRRGDRPIVKLNGVVDDDGTGIELADDKPNVITIEVTAEDGTTKQTYTVTVTRTPLSSDSTLKTLKLTTGADDDVEDVTLTPTFSSGVTEYTRLLRSKRLR